MKKKVTKSHNSIGMSAKVMKEEVNNYYEASMDGFIKKPLEIINKLISKQIMKNRRSYCLLISLLVSLFGSSVQGQSSGRNSLLGIWNDSSKTAVERLDAVLSLSETFEIELADSAIHYNLLGLELARSVENDTFEAMLIFDLGVDYGNAGDFFKAQNTLKEYLNHAIEIKRTKGFSGAIWRISYTYSLNNQLDQLQSYIDSIIPLIEPLVTDELTMAMIYKDSYAGFGAGGYLSKSIYGTLKALELAEKTPNSESERSDLYQDLGYDYCMMGNTSLAQEYSLKSLQLCRQLKDTFNISVTYGNLAQNEITKENYDQALVYIDSSLYYKEKINDDEYGSEVYRGRILVFLNRAKEAIPILLNSLAFFEKGTARNDWASYTCAQLGLAYIQIKDYDKAIFYGERGLKQAAGLQKETMENYEVLYKAWEAKGNKVNAYDTYRGYIIYRDSIANERNTQEVVRLDLENKFQIERFQDSLHTAQQILVQKLDFQDAINRQKLNRNLFLGLGLLIMVFSIGLYSRLRYIRRIQKTLQEKNTVIAAEKEKAQASERAKHQFLANMSHEIRTPMNAIKGMTDILLRRDPNEKQVGYLQGIKQSSASLLVIINDILDISKIEAGKINLENIPFSVEESIQNVHTIMEFKAEEKGLELKTNISENIPQVLGDPTRLRQVLINLIGNAIKFTEKGMVNISMNAEDISPEKMQLHFTVSDTGIGIDEEGIEKIFESFEQAYSDTTRKFGGTGLGLSISKKLVELHGGELWVESEKKKGSQFHFTIPYLISRDERTISAHNLNENKNDAARSLNDIRILLVEDNTFNAVVAQEELEDAISGVQVEVAENGAIAVEKMKSGEFDIILMDIQMPLMNGYEATEKIRAFTNFKSKTPIIAMTANVMKEEVDRCYEAGMDDFIGKPFDTDDLISKLAKLTNK